MKNLSNPVFDGTIQDAWDKAASGCNGMMTLTGYEVKGTGDRTGEMHVLYPQWDSIGIGASVGEAVECSALGLGSVWTVTARFEGWSSYAKPKVER